jgi:hypothetical protein
MEAVGCILAAKPSSKIEMRKKDLFVLFLAAFDKRGSIANQVIPQPIT